MHDQAAVHCGPEQGGESGIVEAVAVVRGIEANARHVVVFVTTPQVLFPVRQERIDGTEGKQKILVGPALLGQAAIHSGQVAMQQAVEASRPGLFDLLTLELGDQIGGFVPVQAAKRPVR